MIQRARLKQREHRGWGENRWRGVFDYKQNNVGHRMLRKKYLPFWGSQPKCVSDTEHRCVSVCVCVYIQCAQCILVAVTNFRAWELLDNPRHLWMTHEKALISQWRDRTERRRKRRRRTRMWDAEGRRFAQPACLHRLIPNPDWGRLWSPACTDTFGTDS